MALYRDHDAASPLINSISFQTTTALVGTFGDLTARGHTSAVATTIVLDAVLMSAISLLATAVNNGWVGVAVPTSEVLHQRLDELLKMELRVHSPNNDGSFDPVGQPLN